MKLFFFVKLENKDFTFVNQKMIEDKSLIEEFHTNLQEFPNDLMCETAKGFKEFSYKTRTRGVVIGAVNCGIIIGFRELYYSESINQIVLFCLDLISFANQMPSFIGYDDGCHLKKFIQKRQIANLSDRGSKLSKMKIFVDRLHMINHKDAWCKENCNMDHERELDGINSMVCEELNFWLSRFKHNVKHMNNLRINFFYFIIMNLRNEYQLLLNYKSS